jgi:hypothetical protein
MRASRIFSSALFLIPLFSFIPGCGGQLEDDPHVQVLSQGLVSALRPPAGYVPTPHGYYHQSCVHEIPEGAAAHVNGHVALADGSMTQLPSCNYPRLVLRHDAINPTTNGWVEDANWTSPSAATRLTSRFSVPAAPSSSSGQVVFFFPGMEPADGTIILQPVLQWGVSAAGGGTNWQIASWSCGPSCVHSKLVKVNTGDSLIGTISGSSCSSTGQCSWKIVTKDATTGKSTTLTTQGDSESYVWLFGGVLEAYGIDTCDQYPANGKETFSSVDFFDQSGNLLAPSYAADVLGAAPACSFRVAPTGSGATITF